MSYTDKLFSSDLDVFRSDGTLYTTSIIFSGTLLASSTQVQTSNGITISNLDFYQLSFDNSIQHSGKFRNMTFEPATYVMETTFGSPLITVLTTQIVNGVLKVSGTLLNAYASNVALQTTTINIRFVAYDSTLL